MNKLKIQLSTNELIIFHLIQRFIYQYHTMFSTRSNRLDINEFTQLWFLRIFVENPYFKNLQNSYLIDYQILENKDLIIVVRSPLNYKSFLISLDTDIYNCVTYTDNENKLQNINIFSIDYEL